MLRETWSYIRLLKINQDSTEQLRLVENNALSSQEPNWQSSVTFQNLESAGFVFEKSLCIYLIKITVKTATFWNVIKM